MRPISPRRRTCSNSDEVQGKLTRAGGRADTLAGVKDVRPDAEKVEELFYWAWAHKPTKEQMDAALAHFLSPSTRRTRRPPTRTFCGRLHQHEGEFRVQPVADRRLDNETAAAPRERVTSSICAPIGYWR